MKRRQLLSAGTGLVVLAVGLVVGGVEGTVDALATTLGGDYFVLVALGGAALLAAAPVVVSARSATLRQAETPAPETTVDRPAAGDGFDEAVSAWRFRLPVVGDAARDSVRERLREAAVGTLVRTRDCDRAQATRLVAEGQWTDDREAATFLAADASRASTVVTAVDAAARLQTPVEYRARAAARAVARLDEQGGR
ncbi:DUF7269 family protein [Salinirubrum litoreum]|uniref:DUF4129 domain-containing protein n=1 Tax=Salinirubrum litoreum TaxID=1126234 RepID=A0ABD5RCA2_9EURY|nr:hypothetical protein [Salinirubrum litoreum]